MDVERSLAIRSANQKRREVLARNVPADTHIAALEAIGLDANRRITFGLQILDIGIQRAERIHKVANRAFTHAFFAAQNELAPTERKRCRQRGG